MLKEIQTIRFKDILKWLAISVALGLITLICKYL